MIGLDIEAVPNEEAIQSRQWAEYKEKHEITYDQEAALHPAFGQVVCICAYDNVSKKKLSVCGADESELLFQFSEFAVPGSVFGGHYIKGYDLPFLANRCIAKRIAVPVPLRTAGLKPWEIPHKDTVELLKFGGGPRISLDAMCLMLGVPSPKEGEVNGLSVWKAFKEGRFDKIASYCGRDVNSWLRCWKVLLEMGAC